MVVSILYDMLAIYISVLGNDKDIYGLTNGIA